MQEFVTAFDPTSDLTTNQYNAMLAGIVYGVIEGEGLTEFEACIKDAKTEASSSYHAFEDLMAKNWTTGFQELSEIVKALPGLMTDCTGIQEDIATLESWATVFLTPAALPSLIKSNVTHNIIKLTRDLKGAKKDYKNEEYFTFGTDLGEMLVIATQPSSTFW